DPGLIIFLTMTKIIPEIDNIKEIIPIQTDKFKGACEKSAIPLNAYLNSFLVVQSVSPATRYTLGSSRYLVLKQTKEKIPLEKRLYLGIDKTALTICRVIMR